MNPATATAAAVTFVWLGMVLAISFLEAPLKFRAPEVTLRIGLSIGRLVFRALNTVEAILAVALAITGILGDASTRIVVAGGAAVAILMVQLGLLRPGMAIQTDRVLAGEPPTRSRGHFFYIALEAAKALALITAGVMLLSA